MRTLICILGIILATLAFGFDFEFEIIILIVGIILIATSFLWKDGIKVIFKGLGEIIEAIVD